MPNDILVVVAFAKKAPPRNATYVDSCLSSIMWHPSCAGISKNEMHVEMSISIFKMFVLPY
jgi:hypothetical protein